MEQKDIDTIFSAVKLLLETSSFAKQNPAVQTPATDKEYATLSEKLMDIIRNQSKEV